MTLRRAFCVAMLMALSATAEAYPYFQRTTGTDQCSACHVSPAGGGILTEWGRDEYADTIAGSGPAGFLHGLAPLPDWLLLQGEFRVAGLASDKGSPEGAELAFFPMQTDLLAAVQVDAISIVASLGYRGQVRDAKTGPGSDASTVADQDALSFLISREHYVMWKEGGSGAYARAGRFYAPFGLRTADHNRYHRRYLGFNILEETYGVSVGWLGHDWEGHVTGFTSDRWRGTGRVESGAAALYERRFGDLIVAGQGRLAIAESDGRAIVGGYAKYWLDGPDILLMAEVDGGRQWFRNVDGAGRFQLAGFIGPTWRPRQGLYLGAGYELYDSDLSVADVTRHALSFFSSYFAVANLELGTSLRIQRTGPDSGALTGLMQLHYTL